MGLNKEQRDELETLGAETVRAKLIHGGAGKNAVVPGFRTGPHGDLLRTDVEDWLAEQHTKEARVQNSTLLWAKIAGWAGIISVIVTVAIGVATIWLAK